MSTKWQEKGIGVMRRRGTSERKPVIDERDGTVGGHQTTHWDDRVDAEVNLKPVEGFKNEEED